MLAKEVLSAILCLGLLAHAAECFGRFLSQSGIEKLAALTTQLNVLACLFHKQILKSSSQLWVFHVEEATRIARAWSGFLHGSVHWTGELSTEELTSQFLPAISGTKLFIGPSTWRTPHGSPERGAFSTEELTSQFLPAISGTELFWRAAEAAMSVPMRRGTK